MNTATAKRKLDLPRLSHDAGQAIVSDPRHLDGRPQYLTVEEVAEIIKVSPAWVRAHANGNRNPVMPSIKLGKYRRFRHQAVLDFIRALECS